MGVTGVNSRSMEGVSEEEGRAVYCVESWELELELELWKIEAILRAQRDPKSSLWRRDSRV